MHFNKICLNITDQRTNSFACTSRTWNKAKTKGLKLVSHLKNDPLGNQIREFPLGTGKQTNKFDLRTNRFSHAYPMVCLPEDELSSSERGRPLHRCPRVPFPDWFDQIFLRCFWRPERVEKMNENEF